MTRHQGWESCRNVKNKVTITGGWCLVPVPDIVIKKARIHVNQVPVKGAVKKTTFAA